MGYYVSLVGESFTIPADRQAEALEAVKQAHREQRGMTATDGREYWWAWTNGEDFQAMTWLTQALHAFGFLADFNAEGDITGLNWEFEKAGDEGILFDVLAPFVAEGSHLDWSGEDDAHWRIVFRGGAAVRETGRVVYDS